MLRTATCSHSRTVTKRIIRAAHASSSSAFRLSDLNGVGSNSPRCRAKDVSPQWVIGIRMYTVSAPKGVKQLVKDGADIPPPPPASSPARTGSSSSSTTGGKKSLEPKLTPRKVGSSSTASHSSGPTNSRSSIRTSEHAYEAPLSRLVTYSSAPSSKRHEGHRNTAPFLLKPEAPPNLGIIKTAFNDIDDALTNGTLEPLPPALLKAQEAQRRRKLASDSAATAVKSSSGTEEGPTMIGDVEFTADTGKIWWHKLKEMTKFYFFGVLKLGREHRVIASQISRQLREIGDAKGVQTWRDREFVKTYRMDLLRLVPFISIVAVLEEVLPLVVIYAPFLLPSTCKLPAQAKRIDDLADVKRWDSLVALGGMLALRDGLDRGRVQSQVFGSPAGAGAPQVLGHENGVLGGRLDRLPEGSIPLLCRLLNIAPYGPSPYLKFRLRSTLAALSSEDTYFANSKSPTTLPKVSGVDAISQLSLSELRTVLGRRGFPTTPLTLPQLRENLKWWLTQKEHPIERRLEAVLELARWSHRESASPISQARS